ncbi:hypothetical protein N7530_010607 [Penicillium desertorum]|uniref:Uncharacterized protein n=1 Tax=Penicillium desertorum TaxID=1303715 RepID=A0A9W9WHR6_9EURO|nr:hypothetical protein N7530_010607 [Penicillium desertorum]
MSSDSDGSVEYEDVALPCSLSGTIVQPALPPTQTSFQFAHPVIKRRRWLLVNPKMVFQVQQLTSDHRPRPVLEFWVRPFRRSKLLPGFIPQYKLKRRGIYAATREPYHLEHDHWDRRAQPPPDTFQSAFEEQQVVAILNREQLADSYPTVMHFRDGAYSWEMVVTPEHGDQCYMFFLLDQCQGDHGCCFSHFQWERRNREDKDGGRFVLLLIDRQFAHKSEIAALTHNNLRVTIYEDCIVEDLRSLHHLTFASLMERHAVPPVASEQFRCRLYTHILAFAAMVAYKERWLR